MTIYTKCLFKWTKKQLTDSDLEKLIKHSIKSKGVSSDISIADFDIIKNKIKEELKSFQHEDPLNEAPDVEVAPENNTSFPIENAPAASPISQTTTVNKNEIELAKKEGELSEKEKELNRREAEIANKLAELQRKEDELKFTPTIPSILNNIDDAEFIIFNTDEVSKGAFALTDNNFHTKQDPDKKISINNLWASNGIRKAKIYLVDYKPYGEIVFDPMNGTTIFHKNTESFESNALPTFNNNSSGTENSSPNQEGLTPEEAKISQVPNTPNIEPVISSVSNEDIGNINISVDFQKFAMERMNSILKDYLSQYPKL